MNNTIENLRLKIEELTTGIVDREELVKLSDGGKEDVIGILTYLMEEAMSSSNGIQTSELKENLIRMGKLIKTLGDLR